MSDLDINDHVLAELRSAADIVEVIGDHTTLKKAGRSWKGLCPFHNERTPSFTVDRDKGLYHCFGCGAGGDVIHFVREIDRLDFPEAVEALASRFGVAIPRRAPQGPRDDRRDRLLEAVAAAQRFYAERLARPGNAAARYLEERGVPEEMVAVARPRPRARRLGLALEGARRRVFPEDLLIEAGLLQPRAEGKGAYDRFRDRLLFVVQDDRGRPVGFGGRALSPGRRAQVPELARVADLLEEASPLRALRGARRDPPARPRRPRRGLLRPSRARARRRRGDGRVDGHRADAGAGREAAAPRPAGDRLLRRRRGRPQRHARRPAAAPRPGLRGAGRAAARRRGPGRPPPARGAGGPRARASTRRRTS